MLKELEETEERRRMGAKRPNRDNRLRNNLSLHCMGKTYSGPVKYVTRIYRGVPKCSEKLMPESLSKIANDLRVFDARQISLLAKGSQEPDSWADFPHHFGKDNEIWYNIS